jgi:hypothetical protein
MTDHAAEAQMVAEAFNRRIDYRRDGTVTVWASSYVDQRLDVQSVLWREIVALVRRLRGAERELSELRQAAEACTDWVDQDEMMRRLVALDDVLGGSRLAAEPPVPEPAYDPPEHCCDGVASVPVRDWMDAQDDFGRRARRDRT